MSPTPPRRIGVCSWSLQPASPAELVVRLAEVGVSACQLALDPLRTGAFPLGETTARLADAGVAVPSGMIAAVGEDYSTLESIRRTGGLRPDQHWRENRTNAARCFDLAAELEIPLVSFHAGFLPHDPGDPERSKLLHRLDDIADLALERGVRPALETGQETAGTMLGVLAELDREDVGVNFDPANMILYGMGDPIDALERLAARVLQVHVKDARRAQRPGEWGREVPVGSGEVEWAAFFRILREREIAGDLMLEREAGDDRVRDLRAARELVERHLAAGEARS